ncbi:MAG: hypothetical protein QGF57_08220 [Candidatus Marinimicrobia bacterium]|nr:hypothetical protein [Candidatus Neomarinimicrobiota bacterium]
MMTIHQDDTLFLTEPLSILSDFYDVEVYTWEYLEDMTKDEIFSYLLEDESVYEFIDFAEQDEEIKTIINSINWETTQ